MTEFFVGFLFAVLAPRIIEAVRRAWEDAAPVPPPAVPASLSPKEVIEAVRALPADPEVLGQLVPAIRRAWEAAAPPAQPEAPELSPERIVAAVKDLPADPDILGQLADALRSLREKVESPKK